MSTRASVYAPHPWRYALPRREDPRYLAVSPGYERFHRDLFECGARVLAAAGDADLVFVGRSPLSVHDLLRGALRLTSWWARLHVLPLSLSGQGESEDLSDTATGLLRRHLELHGLHPRRILKGRPLALVDLSCSGSTFENLACVLRQWSAELGCDGGAVVGKVRFVSIVGRWFHAYLPAWRVRMHPSVVAEVVVPERLWSYLGNRQEKPALSYDATRWGQPAVGPEPSGEHVRARRLGRDLYDLGASKRGRRRLLACLEREPTRRSSDRALIRELRQHCRSRCRRARWPGQRAYRPLANTPRWS